MSFKINDILSKALQERRKNLLEIESKKICIEYGIPVPKFKLAVNETDAVKFAEEIQFPVVLKIVSPDILHKTEIGGVIVNLKSGYEIKNAYHQILKNVKKHKADAKIVGVLVEEMVSPSIEIIIGAFKDTHFGPILMFGLGGIFVEVLKDVTFRVAPITEKEARKMISEVKVYSLLRGYRNKPPLDIDTLINILLNVSKLVVENQEIKELDLNPIFVYNNGAKTVDAKIILE
jgi:acetyl-CoA synthetase (ADP-forming)